MNNNPCVVTQGLFQKGKTNEEKDIVCLYIINIYFNDI